MSSIRAADDAEYAEERYFDGSGRTAACQRRVPGDGLRLVDEIGDDVGVHRGDVVVARRDRRPGRRAAAGCARAALRRRRRRRW